MCTGWSKEEIRLELEVATHCQVRIGPMKLKTDFVSGEFAVCCFRVLRPEDAEARAGWPHKQEEAVRGFLVMLKATSAHRRG